MLKIISQKTLELIKEKIINKKIIKLPIDNKKFQIIYNWLEDEEISLANAQADGEDINQTYLNDICNAIDELFDVDINSIDLDDLNKKLI